MWKRILLWFAVSFLIGNVLWAAFGVFYAGRPETLQDVWLAFLGTAFWGVALCIMISPLYLVAFVAWATAARKWPHLEQRTNVILGSLGLALPLALIVAHGFAGPSWIPFQERAQTFVYFFPQLLISAGAALTIPRLAVPMLKPGAFLPQEVGGATTA